MRQIAISCCVIRPSLFSKTRSSRVSTGNMPIMALVMNNSLAFMKTRVASGPFEPVNRRFSRHPERPRVACRLRPHASMQGGMPVCYTESPRHCSWPRPPRNRCCRIWGPDNTELSLNSLRARTWRRRFRCLAPATSGSLGTRELYKLMCIPMRQKEAGRSGTG